VAIGEVTNVLEQLTGQRRRNPLLTVVHLRLW
jgi:hypothetical protein